MKNPKTAGAEQKCDRERRTTDYLCDLARASPTVRDAQTGGTAALSVAKFSGSSKEAVNIDFYVNVLDL